jgi:tetratricopeptide (TPR) repeat protein
MRRLNVKYVLCLLGLGALVVAGVFLAHFLQTGRTARALLAQAQAAEEQGRPEPAILYLSRYLEFQPNDLDERAHLARLLAARATAGSPQAGARAVLVLEQVLGRDPDRRDCRRLLVRVALERGDLERAREHLKILPEADPEADALRGRLAELQGHYFDGEEKGAATFYARAIQADPKLVEAHVHLAGVLRRHPRPGQEEKQARQADGVIDALVAHNADSYQAHLARWRYRKEFGGLKKDPARRRDAARDVAEAQKLAPDEPEVLVAAAELAELDGRTDQAVEGLKRGLEQRPEEARLYRAWAALEMQAGRRKGAIDCLRQAVKKVPAHAQFEFTWALTNLLIDGEGQDLDEAAALIAPLRKGAATLAAGDYLQGRLLFARKEWAEAARCFERARPSLEATPEVAQQIDLALGRCYEQLADPGRQLDAYKRLAQRAPTSVAARLGRAVAEASLGHVNNAIAQYREALQLPDAPPEARTDLVQLLIVRNLERGDRTAAAWKDVEDALRDAEKAQPDNVEVVLLRAHALTAQGRLPEAFETLKAACTADKDYKQPRLRLALAAVLGLQEQAAAATDRPRLAAAARQALDEVEGRAGDTADLRAARARYWAEHAQATEAPAALARLEQRFDGQPAEEQSRVLRAVAEAYLRGGKLKEAERTWARLARLPGNENDPRLQLLLCQLALETDNEAGLRQAADALRRVEGENGPTACYGEALYLIGQARQHKVSDLARARSLLNRAGAERKGWSALALARAEVAELQGFPEEAIDAYREAKGLGERGPALSRRLVELYYRQQRYKDAEEELRAWQQQAPASADLRILEADLRLRNQDPTRAVQMALQAVRADTPDYRQHLWLGEVLAASGRQPEEAERRLRLANQMNPKAPETWVALVAFYAPRDRDKAARLVEQAKAALAPDQAPLALAPCYEAIDRLDEAEKQYLQALRLPKADVAVLRGVANFYLRTLRPGAAEALLKNIIDRKLPVSEGDVAWARTGMAVVKATRGDNAGFLEALKLLGYDLDGSGRLVDNSQPGENSLELRRARARVLATRPNRALRNQAIKLLLELDGQGALIEGDRLLLSQLLEATDNWKDAGLHLYELVKKHPGEPLYLARYGQNLLRQGEAQSAAQVVDRLEQVEQARQTDFGSVELRARLLEARKRGDEAVALLKKYAARPKARPEDVLLPINSYTRQKRYDDARGLCEAAWNTACPPDVLAAVHVGLLRAAGADEAARRRAEGQVTNALKRLGSDPDPRRKVGLLLALADLEDLRGRFDEAERYYRAVLEPKMAPDNVVARNNLAWLLALRNNKAEEALTHIKKAIDVLGRRPDLLDTRALVYLAQRQADLARADLQESIADTPTASRYFHLARACEMANDAGGKAKALQAAKDLGLKRAHLHPVEQVACASLLAGVE